MLFLDNVNGVLSPVRARAPAVNVHGFAGQYWLCWSVAVLQLNISQRSMLEVDRKSRFIRK